MTGGIVWSDGSSSCNTKTTSGGCSGGFDWERRALKKSCDQHDYCYHGPIVTSFQETYHWCSNLFIHEARALGTYAIYAAEVSCAAMTFDPLWDSGAVVEGWGSNTRCLPGTSCHHCCKMALVRCGSGLAANAGKDRSD